nr:sensor histidine kinase [Rubrivivax gelatinosus]
MDALVEQGLAYARSERLQETRVAVDLDALLDNIAEQARDLGQDCRYAGAGAVTLVAAPRALQRLLQNLVDNALRYAGSAEIELAERADGVEIRVLDRGPGVAGGDLERMFEPFVRGAAARGDDGGSGLGLAIARNLARAHGGELALEPRDGGGLMARVRLPRV